MSGITIEHDLTDIITRLKTENAWRPHYGPPALQIEAADRIAELEAHVRRAIACIESLRPYVMWDGVDGEDEQAKVETTLAMLRGAVKG